MNDKGAGNLPLPISQEEKTLTRRNFIKKSFYSTIGSAFLFAAYSSLIERHWVEIREIEIHSNRIPSSFHGVRIVQFSDLHFGFYMDTSDLKKIAQQINATKPDLICFTGDLIDKEFTKKDANQVANILKQLKSPLGKYAILGNHDYWGDSRLVQECLQEAGFQILMNDCVRISKGTEYIYLSGLDDVMEGLPDIEKVMKKWSQDQQKYHIILVHEPDFAEVISEYPIDLQLSGHSHGGQINFPVIGPLITPPISQKYPLGLYEKINNKNLTLYTNRGLGTTILPLRFFCRPEITVFTLRN